MSEVEKLRDELALAELKEKFLATKEPVLTGNPSEKERTSYKALRDKFAAARTAFRIKYPPPPPKRGDATVMPETVGVASTVKGAK